jgi:transposase-like protein
MAKRRKRYSPDLKFRVALEAARGQETINELASRHGVHPNQIGQWKRQLLEQGAQVFDGSRGARGDEAQEAREAQLYEQVGRLQVELEWVQRKSALFG